MHAKMVSTVKGFPHVPHAQTIALSELYAISAMVLVAEAARKIGQENSAIYHAPLTADNATSLAKRPVHRAKKTFTVIVATIHAMQGVLPETD